MLPIVLAVVLLLLVCFSPRAAAAPIEAGPPTPTWEMALTSGYNPPEATPPTTLDVLADRIQHCESQDIATATNPTSTAKGLFQFLDGTWARYTKELWGTSNGKNVFDPITNREVAMYVLQKYGTHDWDSSKWCWDK